MGIGYSPAAGAGGDMTALEQRMDAVEGVAEEGLAAGKNARQMVLNRDPALNDLKDVAAKFAEEIARTDKIHADLQRGVDAAAARTMTPGPAGKDSTVPGPAGKDSTVPGPAGKDADPARLVALEKRAVLVAFGTANLPPTLAAGATTNVVVTLSRTMGTASYSTGYALAGGVSLLGALQVVGVVAQTATTVTVAVRNPGLTALVNLATASVSVVAARDV